MNFAKALIVGVILCGQVPARASENRVVEFREIEQAHKSMTSVQWDAYTDKVEGTHVCWTGRVSDIKHGWFSGNTIFVDMNDGPVPDQAILEDVTDEVAARSNKGSQISWCGNIYSIRSTLGFLSVSFSTPELQTK